MLVDAPVFVILYQYDFANTALICCSGFSVWKAKNSSLGSSSAMVDSQQAKPVSDIPVTEIGSGKSLRNFSFDTSSILRAMESKFAT